MQTKPWARKHSSGSAMCVAGRLISVSSILSGLLSLRGQSSQQAMLGLSTAPFGGRAPVRMASIAPQMSFGGGAQPGR